MECLICYGEVDLSNDPTNNTTTTTGQEKNDIFSPPTTISRLFDLSPSTLLLEKNDTSSTSIKICPTCHKRVDQVGQMLDQLDELQVKLAEMRKEILYDLIKSQKLSEDDGNQLDQRIRIIQEACTILNGKYDQEQEQDDQDQVDDQNPSHSHTTNGDNNTANAVQDYFSNQESTSAKDLSNDPFGQPFDDTDNVQSKDPESNKPIVFKNKNKKVTQLPNQKKLRDKSKRNSKGKISPVPVSTKKSKVLRAKKSSKNTDDQPKRVKCKHCTLTFKNRHYLQVHKRKDHKIAVEKRPEVGREKICKFCNREFARPGSLDNHIKAHHSDEKSEVCYVCGRAYPTTRSLKAHLVVHGIGNVVYKCNICGKFNGNKNLLQRHLARVHEIQVPDTKSFLCEVCSKSFMSENALKEHQQSIHLGEKFSCDKCVKAFTTSGGLNAHIKSIHEKAFKSFCPTCNKGFLSNSEMSRHQSATHEGIKGYSCSEENCNAKFFTSSRLKYHIKAVHTLERPYACSICSKGFITRQKLKNHEILHTGLRPHACSVCGESYTIKSSLAQHIREVHEGRKVLIADLTKRRKFKRRNRVQIVGNLAEIDSSISMQM